MKKLDQYFMEEDTYKELEKLHVTLYQNISKHEEEANIEAMKQYKQQCEFFSCLNPRYLENEITPTPKEASIKLDSLNLRSNQGLIRNY
ncbi:MAG: hypothetical protein ACW98D_03750 [Promethearchaeota archaeon]